MTQPRQSREPDSSSSAATLTSPPPAMSAVCAAPASKPMEQSISRASALGWPEAASRAPPPAPCRRTRCLPPLAAAAPSSADLSAAGLRARRRSVVVPWPAALPSANMPHACSARASRRQGAATTAMAACAMALRGVLLPSSMPEAPTNRPAARPQAQAATLAQPLVTHSCAATAYVNALSVRGRPRSVKRAVGGTSVQNRGSKENRAPYRPGAHPCVLSSCGAVKEAVVWGGVGEQAHVQALSGEAASGWQTPPGRWRCSPRSVRGPGWRE